MGTMACSLLWVLQDLYRQPYDMENDRCPALVRPIPKHRHLLRMQSDATESNTSLPSNKYQEGWRFHVLQSQKNRGVHCSC